MSGRDAAHTMKENALTRLPRPVALALAGLALTASLAGCGGTSAPVAPPTKPASIAPRPRPTIDTSWMDRQREDARRAADQADQADRERKMRDDFDRKLRDSEARTRCEADNAGKQFPRPCF